MNAIDRLIKLVTIVIRRTHRQQKEIDQLRIDVNELHLRLSELEK